MLLSCECPIRWKTAAFHLGFEIEDTECLRAVRRYGLFVVDNSDVAKAESSSTEPQLLVRLRWLARALVLSKLALSAGLASIRWCAGMPSGNNEMLGLSQSKVGSRRSTEDLPEHGNESARCTVPGFQSGIRNLCALSQEAHSFHEPKLLPPFSEGHADFFLEESLDGPLAGTGHPAKLSERSGIAGVSHKNLCNADGSRIRQMR